MVSTIRCWIFILYGDFINQKTGSVVIESNMTLQILNRGNYKTIILDFNFPSKDININNIYINLKKHKFEILKKSAISKLFFLRL